MLINTQKKVNKNKITTILCIAAISTMGAMTFSSCATATHQESTGQYIDSSAITMKVKAKLLADSQLKGSSITVTTYKSSVQLSGFVNSNKQKARAVARTYSVPGVKEVHDSLIVKRH